MRKLNLTIPAVLFVVASANLAAQPNIRDIIDTACVGVLGQGCYATGSLFATYQAIQIQINNRQLPADSSSVMYNYLIPMVKGNQSWQFYIINTAWAASGCRGDAAEQQWMSAFAGGKWQTYQQLINLMRQQNNCTPAPPPAASVPAAPQYTQLQHQQALYSAFTTVFGRMPAAAEETQFNSVTPPNMLSSVRAMLSRNPGEAPRIATSVFPTVIGRQPTDYEKAGIVGVFGNYWTAADDLVRYLRDPAVTAGLRTPNYGPQSAPVQPAPQQPAPQQRQAGTTTVLTYGGVRLSPYIVNSAGYLIGQDGSGIVAAGAGNFVDPKTGLLMGANRSPLTIMYQMISNDGGTIVAQGGGNIVAQGGGNIVAQGGGNIVAQGGGNIVAQGGGNIVAQGGGNIVAQGGGNIVPPAGGRLVGPSGGTLTALATAGNFSVYNPSAIASLLQQLSAASLASSSVKLAQTSVASIGLNTAGSLVNTNGSNLVNTNGSNYRVQSVGGTPPAQAPPAQAAPAKPAPVYTAPVQAAPAKAAPVQALPTQVVQSQTNQQLADAGNGEAMFQLGNSAIVARNLPAAYQWYWLALAHASTLRSQSSVATYWCNSLWEHQMTVQQQDQAKKLINDWKAAHPGK